MILTIYFSLLLQLLNIHVQQKPVVDIIAQNENLKEGDIIFQSTGGEQGEALMLATKSKYTHCGIIFKDKNKWYVYEAIQPVQVNTLADFIERGEGEHYVIKRLKGQSTLPIEKMKAAAKTYLGKDYDIFFNWSNEEIYCSELVYKIYSEGAGIEICNKKYLKDYDLSNPNVKALMKKRYGNKIPLNEMMIAPSTIFESEKMELVVEK
jgi:uncharacterized protein YycO